MNKAIYKLLLKTSLTVAVVLLASTTAFAQYTNYGDNVIVNGDFSLGDSLWTIEGSNGTVTHDDTLKFVVNTAGNAWELQSYQVLTAEQIAALAEGGTWELSFDAMTPDDSKNFHVFLGHNGGGWERYWNTASGSGTGDVQVDGEMKTYTLTTDITETWESMKLGFEVAGDDSDLYIDNIQLRKASSNIVINGDFALGDSAWSLSPGAANIAVTEGELAFTNIPGVGNTYDVQAMHVFSEESLDSIYAGPYRVSFDARTSEGSQLVHLFFGEIGGGWARYFPESSTGRVTVDTEMTNYVFETNIEETYPAMQLGFEVNYAPGDFYVDNIILSRITDVVPDAPEVQWSTENGVVTISVTDNGAASYDVYFADSAFSTVAGGARVASIDPAVGLTATHSIQAPHPSLVENFDAYYGVLARSDIGSPSDMTTGMINTSMTVRENYIVELSAEAVDAVASAVEDGVVPEASVLASFFPADYTPFEINTQSVQVEGGDPVDSNQDLSAKFWVGIENTTGSDLMIFYAEIMDDIIVPANNATNGGGGWNFDSWEGGIGSYSPQSIITGSDHGSFESGDEPDYQLRAGYMVGADPYIHAWDGDAGDPGYNQFVGNSATVGDSSQAGMYRLLTILSTIEFSGVNASAKNFDFPTGSEVTTIPFQLAVNDNDGTSRDAQYAWSSKSTSQWWNTPSEWEVVAMVGSEATYTSNEPTPMPSSFELKQNYPNPFNPTTTIQFSLATAQNVTLEVYNMLGQKVATLVQNQPMTAGIHTQSFDASALASGMYIYKLYTPEFSQSRRMMLIK
ncbi:MAG: T9SS type A sorting domain-containing protein [Bacteroidetes bacterium]|nr:T9SS type A sorting domain-containing protein [Bacteroidota bacterium]